MHDVEALIDDHSMFQHFEPSAIYLTAFLLYSLAPPDRFYRTIEA